MGLNFKGAAVTSNLTITSTSGTKYRISSFEPFLRIQLARVRTFVDVKMAPEQNAFPLFS